jgi:hypothetical protein
MMPSPIGGDAGWDRSRMAAAGTTQSAPSTAPAVRALATSQGPRRASAGVSEYPRRRSPNGVFSMMNAASASTTGTAQTHGLTMRSSA